MCGIAGMLQTTVNNSIIQKMLMTMQRRGPDEKGIYWEDDVCLLHARLAVIDPDNGKQPMRFAHYTLVYNGELYNTAELRNELLELGHHFKEHSDTEVLLHAYAQWGERCLEKLNGIFAFAVWDEHLKTLFLARDRIGVKPLFYTLSNNGFLFASEIKTLFAHPQIEPKLDSEGIAQILLLGPGRIPGSGVFRGIQELEPGCCGVYCQGKWVWKRYWKLLDREHTQTLEDTTETVRQLLSDSIKRQLVSDVPIGAFLSGGLDSSLICAVAAEHFGESGKQLPTFSVDYEGNDRYFVPGKFQPNSDTQYITVMQRFLNSEHHWTVLTSQELADHLQAATEARDLPGMADVDFSLLAFCAEIKKRVTVALSGECADEIFGGYPWYRDPEIRSAHGFPWSQNIKERAAFLMPELCRKLNPAEFVMDHYRQTIDQCDILPGASRLERRMKEMVNLNFRWFMQTLLDRKDRMSMYHGLEVRVPFCDYRIAEYMYGVPWKMKDLNGREKGLLRYAMSDFLPDEILWRKKSPYPKTFHPEYLTLMQGKLEGLIHDPQSPLLQIVPVSALKELLEGEQEWPWYGQLMRKPQTIAYMLQIDHWLRQYHVELV